MEKEILVLWSNVDTLLVLAKKKKQKTKKYSSAEYIWGWIIAYRRRLNLTALIKGQLPTTRRLR